jgi:hypothetical protein
MPRQYSLKEHYLFFFPLVSSAPKGLPRRHFDGAGGQAHYEAREQSVLSEN